MKKIILTIGLLMSLNVSVVTAEDEKCPATHSSYGRTELRISVETPDSALQSIEKHKKILKMVAAEIELTDFRITDESVNIYGVSSDVDSSKPIADQYEMNTYVEFKFSPRTKISDFAKKLSEKKIIADLTADTEYVCDDF